MITIPNSRWVEISLVSAAASTSPKAFGVRRQRAILLASCAMLSALPLLPQPAAAQFICIGNATGAAVPPGTADGAGATATGPVQWNLRSR